MNKPLRLAHEGEEHSEPEQAQSPAPQASKASPVATTQQAAEQTSSDTPMAASTLWLLLLVAPLAIFVLTTVLLKKATATSALLIASFLLAFGIYSYQQPGPYTAIAIGGGFMLIFVMTIGGLLASE